MKHKSLSQMNKERKLKPMTLQEEYRNADVPMPNDLLDESNTEEFKYNKNVFKDKTISDDYKSGGAYRALLKMFHNNLKEENDNNKKRSKRVWRDVR